MARFSYRFVALSWVLCALLASTQPQRAVAAESTKEQSRHSTHKSASSIPRELACTTSDECVISCPMVQGCCGFPCGCTRVVNKKFEKADARNYAKTCTRQPHCPAVDCAYKPAYGAKCEAGRCVAVTEPLLK